MEFNSKYNGPRCSHSWTIMDGEAAITVLKPFSGEFSDKSQYLVVYEDAYGDTNTKEYTLEQIAMYYMVDMRELEDNLL